MREFHQRERVDDDFLTLALQRQRMKRPASAETSAVDKACDRLTANALYQLSARCAVIEIKRHEIDSSGMLLAKFTRELIEAFSPSRNQHQWISTASQITRDLSTDAGRGTGDHDGGVGVGFRKAHADLSVDFLGLTCD